MATQSSGADKPGKAEGDALPHIDVSDPQALQHWAGKLDCTPQQIEKAVQTVGPLAADVEMHLKGSHSTTSADETRQGSA